MGGQLQKERESHDEVVVLPSTRTHFPLWRDSCSRLHAYIICMKRQRCIVLWSGGGQSLSSHQHIVISMPNEFSMNASFFIFAKWMGVSTVIHRSSVDISVFFLVGFQPKEKHNSRSIIVNNSSVNLPLTANSRKNMRMEAQREYVLVAYFLLVFAEFNLRNTNHNHQ